MGDVTYFNTYSFWHIMQRRRAFSAEVKIRSPKKLPIYLTTW